MKIISALLVLFVTCNSYAQSLKSTTQIKWVVDNKGKKLKKESVTQKDSKGNVIRSEEYTDGINLCQTFQYNYSNDLKIKKTSKPCNSAKYSYTVYIYDKLKRIIEEDEYDSKQKLQLKSIDSYLGNGTNISFTEKYDGYEKRPYSKSTFEYYANGLLKKETQTAGGSWFLTNTYKYDANKLLIYEDGIADGGVGLVKYYYTYQNGILTKDMVKSPDSEIEYHIYEVK